MYTTPQVKDTYSRRIINTFDEREIISVPTGAQSFFGMNGKTLFEPDATVFEYDVIRGSATIAPQILRGTDAPHHDSQPGLNTQKYTNFPRVFPLIEDKATITAEQITKTMAGEASGGGMTRQARMRIYARDLHAEMIRRCFRTQEYLAWQVILTGEQPNITGETSTDLVFDFKRKSTHAFSPAAAWSNDSTDIMGDLDTCYDLNNVDGYLQSDILLCGSTGIKAIFNNTALQNYADNRRYELMNIGATAERSASIVQHLSNNGFEYRGYVTTEKGRKFYLFVYDYFYELSGTQYYLPADKVVMTGSKVIADKIFGPRDGLDPSQQEIADYRNIMGLDITQAPMKAINQGTQSFNPQWYYFGMERARKNITLYTQTAPVFAPKQTDGWTVITVS